jgi:D-serine deaminase-like pyridoxal phosphate-dependent protein
VKQLISQIIAAGYNSPVIVAGGTPTFPVFAQMEGVECSPGTFILWDEGYRALFADLPFLPAALVVTRVISALDENIVCLDMGHKAIAAENDLDKRVTFLNAQGVQFVGHSEEHLVIKTPETEQFKIGDVLYGLPVHICPTCNLYDRANIITDARITAEWKIIARDRVINV